MDTVVPNLDNKMKLVTQHMEKWGSQTAPLAAKLHSGMSRKELEGVVARVREIILTPDREPEEKDWCLGITAWGRDQLTVIDGEPDDVQKLLLDERLRSGHLHVAFLTDFFVQDAKDTPEIFISKVTMLTAFLPKLHWVLLSPSCKDGSGIRSLEEMLAGAPNNSETCDLHLTGPMHGLLPPVFRALRREYQVPKVTVYSGQNNTRGWTAPDLVALGTHLELTSSCGDDLGRFTFSQHLSDEQKTLLGNTTSLVPTWVSTLPPRMHAALALFYAPFCSKGVSPKGMKLEFTNERAAEAEEAWGPITKLWETDRVRYYTDTLAFLATYRDALKFMAFKEPILRGLLTNSPEAAMADQLLAFAGVFEVLGWVGYDTGYWHFDRGTFYTKVLKERADFDDPKLLYLGCEARVLWLKPESADIAIAFMQHMMLGRPGSDSEAAHTAAAFIEKQAALNAHVMEFQRHIDPLEAELAPLKKQIDRVAAPFKEQIVQLEDQIEQEVAPLKEQAEEVEVRILAMEARMVPFQNEMEQLVARQRTKKKRKAAALGSKGEVEAQ